MTTINSTGINHKILLDAYCGGCILERKEDDIYNNKAMTHLETILDCLFSRRKVVLISKMGDLKANDETNIQMHLL